jgi:hypothetical protein
MEQYMAGDLSQPLRDKRYTHAMAALAEGLV